MECPRALPLLCAVVFPSNNQQELPSALWHRRGSIQRLTLKSVSVVKVPQKTLLMDALKEETEMVYDFCMCNPPFFANQLEAKVRPAVPQTGQANRLWASCLSVVLLSAGGQLTQRAAAPSQLGEHGRGDGDHGGGRRTGVC